MFVLYRLLLIPTLLLPLAAQAQGILYSFSGEGPDEAFGNSVSVAGDINKDGYNDLIVGAPGNSDHGYFSGSAQVINGITGDVLYTFNGSGIYERFGRSVSDAGDVNGDGYVDVVVGAENDDNNGTDTGSAQIFSGKDGSTLYIFNGDHSTDPSGYPDLFGRSVSGAGDVNNDGYGDIIVGAWGDDNTGYQSGSTKIFSGIDGSVLYTLNGSNENATLGYSVSAAGDVNLDGYADVIVGIPGDGPNAYAGSARVISGINGSILYILVGDGVESSSDRDGFGISVDGAGDVNNDGYPDLIIGAPLDDPNGTYSGSAKVFSGADGHLLHTFYGSTAYNAFGTSVSGAGDVNADGYADIIVGAPWGKDNNARETGSAHIFSGMDGSVLYALYGDDWTNDFGTSVSNLGDINTDGYADVVVGAPGHVNNGNTSGMARVFSGKALWSDADNDGQNDAIDADDDNDTLLDIEDAKPLDTDNDGLNNNTDWDDDNDGVPDVVDVVPLNATNNNEISLPLNGSYKGSILRSNTLSH